MEIVVSKCRVALRAFALTRVVSCFQTIDAKHVETFRQDGVFWTCVADWTHQF